MVSVLQVASSEFTVQVLSRQDIEVATVKVIGKHTAELTVHSWNTTSMVFKGECSVLIGCNIVTLRAIFNRVWVNIDKECGLRVQSSDVW